MSSVFPVRTRIAGTMSGEEFESRQLALKEWTELAQADRPRTLDIVPDWSNPFDPNALQLFMNLPTLGRIQVGFIKNSDSVCDFCQREYTRFPPGGVCSVCKRKDHLRRTGVATLVSEAMRADPELRVYAIILDVTGGVEGKKSYGCNLEVRSFVKREES